LPWGEPKDLDGATAARPWTPLRPAPTAPPALRRPARQTIRARGHAAAGRRCQYRDRSGQAAKRSASWSSTCPRFVPVASPGDGREGGHQLQHLLRPVGVCADALRAGHCLRHVRDHSVTPATNLIAEEPRAAQAREAHSTFGYHPAVGFLVALHRRHLDDETVSVESNLQCRVVRIASSAAFVACNERSEHAAAPSRAVQGLTPRHWKPMKIAKASKTSEPGTAFVDVVKRSGLGARVGSTVSRDERTQSATAGHWSPR
jgi:hypothetical protein